MSDLARVNAEENAGPPSPVIEIARYGSARSDAHDRGGEPFSKPLRQRYARGAECFGGSRRPLAPREMRDAAGMTNWGVVTAAFPALMFAGARGDRRDGRGVIAHDTGPGCGRPPLAQSAADRPRRPHGNSAGADVFARLASWLWATRICRNSAGNADVAIRRDDESHSESYVISSPAPEMWKWVAGRRARSTRGRSRIPRRVNVDANLGQIRITGLVGPFLSACAEQV